MLNRLKKFTGRSWCVEGCAGSASAAIADELDAPFPEGGMLFAASKKRRKKKKTSATRPPTGKAQQRKVPGLQHRDRHDQLAARADSLFARISDYFAAAGYTGRDWGRLAILAASMLVVLYYSFSAGGFFVVRRSYGELIVLYLLVMGLIFSLRTEGRLHRRGLAEIACFGGYVFWMLLSTIWSSSPADSIIEFNRGVLYLAGFLIFYLFLARKEWLGWLAALFVILVAIVAVDGLLLKVVPDIMADYFDIGDLTQQIVSTSGVSADTAQLQAIFLKMDSFQTNRLSYPLTYWNTMGLFMIMAMPIALRGAANRMLPLVIRCYYAAVQVLFAAVVYFTFSRGGYLLVVAIVTLYLLLSSHPLRVTLQAGLTGLWAALTIIISRQFLPAMVATQPSIDERVSQGHKLGWIILILLLLAVAAQVIVARLEGKIGITREAGRKVGLAIAGLAVVCVFGGFALITAPSGGPFEWFQEQLSGAAAKTEAVETSEERLFSLQSERYDEYQVSLRTMADHPLGGTGAGTWGIAWLQHRPYEITVKDGHSWLFDTLAELGLVGTLLLTGFVAAFVAVAVQDLRKLWRKPSGDLYAAIFAACVALLVHSIIDWDWEMPVVSLSFFMLAGGLLRYGMLASGNGAVSGIKTGSSDAEEQIAGSDAIATSGSSWWIWALGLACVAMMVLTVQSIITETRHDAARQRLNQAKALVDRNMTDDGAAWYRDALDMAANARRYNMLDARLLVQMGDARQGMAGVVAEPSERQSLYAAAEQDYLAALELQPDNFEIYQSLAEVYLRTAQAQKAADAMHRARQLNPLSSIPTYSLEERVRVLLGDQVVNAPAS